MADDSWPSPNHNSRAVNDTEYDLLLATYSPSGLIGTPADTATIFGDSSGRQVKVRAARYGLVRGRLWYSGAADFALAISANSSGSTRFDLVVLRYTKSSGDVRATVITGTPGAGVPSPVNNASFFDVSLASVKVVNGASTINSTDVTRLAYFVAPAQNVCTSSTLPPHAAGLEVFETDTGNRLISNGSSWITTYSDTGLLTWSMQPNWTAALNEASKLNGQVSATLQVQRNGTGLTAGTDSPVAKLPAACIPATQKDVIGFAGSGTMVRGHIDGTAAPNPGLLTIFDYPASIAVGTTLSFHQISFRA